MSEQTYRALSAPPPRRRAYDPDEYIQPPPGHEDRILAHADRVQSELGFPANRESRYGPSRPHKLPGPKAKQVVSDRGELFDSANAAGAKFGLVGNGIYIAISRKSRCRKRRWYYANNCPPEVRAMIRGKHAA